MLKAARGYPRIATRRADKSIADVYVQYNTWQCPTLVRMRSGLFSDGSEATAQALFNLYLKLVRTYDAEGVKMMTGTDGGSGDSWQIAGYSWERISECSLSAAYWNA
ncbi:hypothetical protein [Paenibacillus sonchi]|uniref:hypothetical protein n=1 Tax=Paenibacillus sonchi TaxID=373687 RepID=UPI001E62870A|nr:hypothetical protein [Paenibacillus sonchi]MCE3198714.1 hypothetical protein [Paenibacillus sonchi]